MIERGLFQHYKGGLYFVHGVVKHSEQDEELVHYESAETGQEWVRPLAMFTEQVGGTPRFAKIEGSRFFKGKGDSTSDGNKFAHVGASGKLVFHFKSPEAALAFKGWLCGSGEQGYWDWVRESEIDDPDVDIVSVFKYHTGTNHVETELLPNRFREEEE